MKYLNLLWNLYRLKKNTRMSKEQMKKLQNKKLRKLLLFAYDNSAYYCRMFQSYGITREQINKKPLSEFPVIQKAEFLEHFDELVTTPELNQDQLRKFDREVNIGQKKFKHRYHVVHSSGSTGKPGYFVYDDKAWNQMLTAIIRGALWNMTMPEILKLLWNGPRIVYIAATQGRYGGAMAVGSGIEGVHAKQLFLDINTPLSLWIEKIKNFKPNMVIGYPSAIKILGELVEKGTVQLKVHRVVSCGEPLNAGMREYLEKTFCAEVINIYGASESLALGVESSYREGMYLFDDMNYIEVENGDMYLTSLYNYVQPLIRYKISDQLTLKSDDKASPYPFTKADNLLGRNEDLIWFEDGEGEQEFLHPLAIEGFCIEGLLDYQFRQIDKAAFEMLTEVFNSDKKDAIQKEILNQMKKILQEKKLDYVQFYVRFVDEILPDPNTGKKKLILQKNQISKGLQRA